MHLYKRNICWENIAGHWRDAQFYATPDELVVQFVETAYPDTLSADLPVAEKVRRLRRWVCQDYEVADGWQTLKVAPGTEHHTILLLGVAD